MECPVCLYRNPEPLLRCPDCGRLFPTLELEELYHLKYLGRRLESWQGEGAGRLEVFRDVAEEVRGDIARLEERLGITVPATRAMAEAERPPSMAGVPTPAPGKEIEVELASLPTPVPAATSVRQAIPQTQNTTTLPGRLSYPRPAPGITWARVGEALLSRRTLQTLLYLGATLLVLSAIILVVRLWDDLHWSVRQVILLMGMGTLLWAGYHVREKMKLRLSGGALTDIGALWLPLNVGALLFEFLDVQGEAAIPGVRIPLGLPMVGWMAIAATSTPVYAFLAYRFRLIILAYGAAIGAGATLLTGLAALGAPLEWQLVSVLWLSPVYLWLASTLRRHHRDELGEHLFWLAQATLLSLLATVVGLVATAEGSLAAATVAAWSALLFYALAFWLYRHLAFQYLALIGLPMVFLMTLALHVTALPLAWYNLMLIGMATVYVLASKSLQMRLRHPAGSPAEGQGRWMAEKRGLSPLLVVAAVMTIAAALWPVATVLSAIVSLYTLVGLLGMAAWWSRQQGLAYIAAFLLFAPFALTIHWLDMGPHWRAMLFAPLAVVYLVAAEVDAARHGQRRLAIKPLMDFSVHLKSLYTRPLFLAGCAASVVAMVLGAVDLVRVTTDDGNEALVFDFVGAGPAPWTYLWVVGIYAASAYWKRSALFTWLAALVFLPFILLLAERGFYVGWSLGREDYPLLLGALSLLYLGLGLALDRMPGHYSRMPYLIGYTLTVVGMAGTIETRAYNLALVSMSTAIYAFSAYLVHRGNHPAFQWLIYQMFPDETSPGKWIARGVFLYLATGLFPVAVLLAIRLGGPEVAVAWYGVALTLIALAYIVIAEVFRSSDPIYRNQWYIFGYGLSAIGPLLTLADPTLRIATIAISTARYAASALMARQPLWVYPVAVLLPVLLVLGMERVEVPVRYYSVALLSLTVAYSATGLAWRPGNWRLLWPSSSRSLRYAMGQSEERGAGRFTLPLFVVAFPMSVAGLFWLSVGESGALLVTGSSIAALYYLLATIALRETWLLYPAVGLLAVAYSVGLTLTDIGDSYYGLALLPGAVVALAIGLFLEGYPDHYRPTSWLLRLSQSHTKRPTFSAPMLPFCLAAYAGSVAVAVLSVGEGWLLFWGLVSDTAIYGYSAWRFRAPLWAYPALLAAHIAFLKLLFLLSPDLSWAHVGAYWIPIVFLMASLAASAVLRPSNTPSERPRRSLWPLPFFSFAVLGAILSTALASLEADTGLMAGLAYAVPLAVGASLRPGSWWGLAWAAMTYLALALVQGLRLVEVPVLDAPVYVALTGLTLVVASYVVQRVEARRTEEAKGAPSPWLVWQSPLRVFSFLAMALAPTLGLAFWLAEEGSAQGLQPLVFTLAVTGLALVGMAYLERRVWLTYLAVALLGASYMTQLVIFDAGQPQLFIIPAAFYLVAVAYLERRRQHHSTGGSVLQSQTRGMERKAEGTIVSLLETAGLALLLGVTLLQSLGMFTDGVDHQIYGLFLFFESLAVTIWGLAVRWKRPFFGGVAVFIANLAVLLFDPLGEGPVSATLMWSIFGVVGTVLVICAVYLERNREKVVAGLRGFIDRLESWD